MNSKGATKRTARGSPLVGQKGGKGAMPPLRNRAALDDEQTGTLLRQTPGLHAVLAGIPPRESVWDEEEKGETVYTLLRNCTAVGSDKVDEYYIPTGRQGQIMVAPLRSYGPLVVEYLQHLTAAVRHFHQLVEGTMVVSQDTLPKIRWVGDKVAAICLTFVKPEYAATVMSTTLAHLPLYCGKLGADIIADSERAIPRVRIANREGDRGGAEERQLCITSVELKG
ncbi:hypothetical protein CYMTET_3828 [Cymbomonas tetramitiformis]|uniref:Uncharacterized protein n=1 Tax=Cymbomonas tetramitiformis TaxID=36881 RepID=A0AAE0H2V0_9CHLO|nr:hypothetical protein CYMTET_41311 [Cymbomonas tetramitiformis]KAK3288705.1 hypothetical protein CYMTET_3828 [Cymbomonas tetramitiformis]